MRCPRKLGSAIVTIAFLSFAKGANREKVLAQNADDSIWALDGDSIRLVCRHSRTSIAQWFRRSVNGAVTQLVRAITTTNVGTVLTLTMSQSLNGSSYRCRLIAVGLSPVFDSGQNRLLLGDEIKVNCSNEMTACVKVGETLKKRCIITGLPEPNVTVFKITKTSLSRRLPSADRSGLTFNNVALTDRGTYRVTAKNILQENSSDIAVRTEVEICLEPVVNNFLIPDPVVCLQTARINFTVKGIPTPNVTWSSLFSARMIINVTDSVDSDEVTSVVASALEIRNVQRGDSNICVTADNGIPPSLQRCARLNVTCDFDPPLVEVGDRTESSLSLQVFDSPDNNRLQAMKYFISYWQFTSSVKNVTIQRDPSGQTSVHFIDLNPSASYNIRVVARNEPYYSQPADHVFATLKENDCVPTLRRVRVDPLVINWTYVCEGSQTLKKITSYVIVHQSPKDYRQFSLEKVVTEYSFCDLHFNTTYNLSVTAITQNGVLRKSNILTVLINKYSEMTTVKTSPHNTGLIAGVTVLSALFVASGLIALYLFCYIKRSNKQNQNGDSATGGSASKTRKPVEMQSSVLYESAKSVVSKGDPKQSSTAEYAQIS
ncbi:netrin receptor unc-40-like isoform X2 [Oscarella lobularis]|uniref:netrin receptor unc-40-like isoform X2 n=1 Tax=Oscarella lobularis TaxID=121494 RepID=UPI003313F5D6